MLNGGRFFCLSLLLFFMVGCRDVHLENETKHYRPSEPTPAVMVSQPPVNAEVLSTKASSKGIKRKVFKPSHPVPKYSLSAINVPIEELLFQIAVEGGYELELGKGVSGNVTVNVIQRPIERILGLMTQQVNAEFGVNGETIVVRNKMLFWRSYQVDFVNLNKETKDINLLSMAVGNSTHVQSKEGSKFELRTQSKQDFWSSLEQSLSGILGVNSNQKSARPIQQDGQNEQALEKMQRKDARQVRWSDIGAVDRSLVVNASVGMISVFGDQQQHATISEYLSKIIRRANRQVLIEATVIEVELSDEFQAGIDWQVSTQNKDGKIAISQALTGANLNSAPNVNASVAQFGGLNLELGLKLLQAFGNAKVLSRPKIMAMNNQPALLKVVDNQVYFTVNVTTEPATSNSLAVTTFETEVHTVPVGFVMNITPFISDSDVISLNIRPTLSRIVNFVEDPNPELAKQSVSSRIPVVQAREMESMLRLHNRQTAVIGGLIQDTHQTERFAVPLLGDLPWLGRLFSYEKEVIKKSELIILIRPVIVDTDQIHRVSLDYQFEPLSQVQINLSDEGEVLRNDEQ